MIPGAGLTFFAKREQGDSHMSSTPPDLRAELGRELAQALGDARALFLVGHGIVAVGSTVANAVTTAVLFERACRLQILALAAGEVAPELRSPGARYAHTESDRYLLRTWEHLLRRVTATRKSAVAN